jgi:lysophospholipase L1-like esterase
MALLMAMALAATPCTAPLCQPEALAPWFAKLAHIRIEAGRRPLHILQIGDSHTAGDAVTGGWRDILQARHASGGRGVLAAGRPYDGYLTRGVRATMTPGWRIASTFGKASAEPRPPIGVAGFSLTAQVTGATMALAAEPDQAFDRFTVCALARPGAGRLALRVGFTTIDWDLNSFVARPECRTVTTPSIVLDAQIVASGGPVTLTSWASFRDAGGVVLSNVGVVGSQLAHFARTDDGVIAEELRAYRPDLIVLAFGTNEGFAPRFSPFDYEMTLRAQIGRIRRLAGDVPILMLAAPDAATRNIALRSNAPGVAVDCTDQPTQTIADVMAALRASEAAGEGAITPTPAAPAVTRPLFAPPGLAAVRDVQRMVAQQLGVALWDWQGRMGGACIAPRWVAKPEPLMRGDFVHFTSAGGREVARLIDADLTAAAAIITTIGN